MEKEINCQFGQVRGDFFFENFDLSVSEQKSYTDCLLKCVKAFNFFLNDDFEINKPILLNINLCTDEEMIRNNEQYRNKKKITDVLSFPLQENLRAGDYDSFLPEIELGDIFICHSVCEAQAQEFNIGYFDEFIHLLVHGVLHLCGYDHELNETEEILMESFEKKIIDEISKYGDA